MDKRIRSPNYPSLSLPAALEKVALLYKNQHTHGAPREVVAKGMGYNSLNGASATAISALHKYGLLERIGDDIKISERALRILHPHSSDEKMAAIREAASQPELFAELAERFPGQTPSEDLLRNYLIRKGFAPNAVTGVILAYRETVELVGRFGGPYDSPSTAVIATEVTPQMSIHHPPTLQGTVIRKPLEEKDNERSLCYYPFEDGSYVRLVAGGDVSTESALEMAETLIALKRRELQRRNQERQVLNSSVTKEGEENDHSA